MVTTIKITQQTKELLNQLKNGSQTYDELVAELAQNHNKKNLREKLIQGYKDWDTKQQKEFDEWESASL